MTNAQDQLNSFFLVNMAPQYPKHNRGEHYNSSMKLFNHVTQAYMHVYLSNELAYSSHSKLIHYVTVLCFSEVPYDKQYKK